MPASAWPDLPSAPTGGGSSLRCTPAPCPAAPSAVPLTEDADTPAAGHRRRELPGSGDTEGGPLQRGPQLLAGAGARRKGRVVAVHRVLRRSIHQYRLDRSPGLGVHQVDSRTLRREVLGAPAVERHDDGPEVASARSQDVLVAHRPSLIGTLLQQTTLDQAVQTPGQRVRRDAQVALELIEAGHAVERVAKDQNAPPLTHTLQAQRHRAVRVLERGDSHDGSLCPSRAAATSGPD